MEKKKYIQPRMKTILMPQLLQEFDLSGPGDAGGGAAKGFDDSDSEENNVWKVDW